MKNKVLFDTSALLTLMRKESGYEQLESLLASSSISAVNLTEIVNTLSKLAIPITEIEELLNELIPEVIPFTHKISILAGSISLDSELSLADKASIATAIIHNMALYTTNIQLKNLKIDNLNITIIN